MHRKLTESMPLQAKWHRRRQRNPAGGRGCHQAEQSGNDASHTRERSWTDGAEQEQVKRHRGASGTRRVTDAGEEEQQRTGDAS